MSTVLPRIRVKRGNIGNELFVHLPDLNEFEKSFLSSDEAAGQTVLSVLSSENFKNDTYIVIGIPGTERAEIRLLTATGADTDGQLTVTVATTFNHPKGTLITFIPFNQLEISSASEVGGSYSVAATIDLQPDSLETYYQAGSDASTIAYKVRFKNVKDTEFSDFSDEVVGAGYADNTVFSIKKRALAEMGEEIGGTITDEVLNDSLWKARREVDNLVKKWSFRTSFNSVLGVVSEGQWRMAVPSTLRSPDSPDNILSIRLGTEGVPISYVSKRVFDERYAGGAHATVGTAITTSDITAVLDSVIGSGDFDESGTIDVGSDKGVTYTGNDEDTETLSGIPASGDGSFASNHAAGVDVWQDIQYGLPYQYTIFEDFIYFNVPFDSEYVDANVFIDFYRTMPEFNSDADVLDETEYDMYVHYLKAIIRQIKSKGKRKIENDSDYKVYQNKSLTMVSKDRIAQRVQYQPDISHLENQE